MLFPLIWGWQFGSSSRSLQSGDASKQLLLVLFEMKILNYAVVYKQLQETFPTVNLQFFLKVIKDVIIQSFRTQSYPDMLMPVAHTCS